MFVKHNITVLIGDDWKNVYFSFYVNLIRLSS